MADLPDTFVFATLPSTQRCAGGHYRQAGSVSAITHMMPSSFSSIVLTWLLFISTTIVTSALRRNVHVRSGSPPPPPPPPPPNALHSSSIGDWSSAVRSLRDPSLREVLLRLCIDVHYSQHVQIAHLKVLGWSNIEGPLLVTALSQSQIVNELLAVYCFAAVPSWKGFTSCPPGRPIYGPIVCNVLLWRTIVKLFLWCRKI